MLKNTEILRTSWPELLYNHSTLSSYIEKALEDVPILPNKQAYYINVLDITGLNKVTELKEWIEEYLLSIKDQFDNSNAKKINFTTYWVVKIVKGSTVECHIHSTIRPTCGIAIFYFQTPPEGSNLVLVKDGDLHQPIESQIQENCNIFNAKAGDLLVHSNTAIHGMYKYTSDKDTIALVFDFGYIE